MDDPLAPVPLPELGPSALGVPALDALIDALERRTPDADADAAAETLARHPDPGVTERLFARLAAALQGVGVTDFDFVLRAGIPEPRRSSLQAEFNRLEGPLRTRETLVGRLCRVLRERAPDALDATLVPLCDPATGSPSERLRRVFGSALAGRNLGALVDPLPQRANDSSIGLLAANFRWDLPLDAFALGLDALLLVDPWRAAAALGPLFEDATSDGCVDLTRRMLRVLDGYTARVVPGRVPELDAMMGSLLVGPRGVPVSASALATPTAPEAFRVAALAGLDAVTRGDVTPDPYFFHALAAMGDARFVPGLVQTLKLPALDEHLVAIARALKALGDPSAAPALREAIASLGKHDRRGKYLRDALRALDPPVASKPRARALES